MGDRSRFCATCGARRPSLQAFRGSWENDTSTVFVPRREDVEGRPVQAANDLICHAAVWRNGGTADDLHLCDDCLRIGLRAIKADVDGVLDVLEADADKDAETASL